MSRDIGIPIGSIWHARDGRIMRVEEIIGDPIFPSMRQFDRPRVRCTVLNADEQRCRAETTIGARDFGAGKFLHEKTDGETNG